MIAFAAAMASVGAAQTRHEASANVSAYLEVASFASLSVSSSPTSTTLTPDLGLYLKNDGNGTMIRDANVQADAPSITIYCWANKDSVLDAEVSEGRAVRDGDAVTVPIVFGWPGSHTTIVPARASHYAQVLTLDVAANAPYPGGGGSSSTDADGLYNALVTVTIATE